MLSQKKAGSIVGLVALLAAATFLILGFTIGNWHLIWLVFLAIPISSIIVNLVKKETDDENPDQKEGGPKD